MTTDLARVDDVDRKLASLTTEQFEGAMGALAHVLGTGDLYQLTNEQRVGHYLALCHENGLKPRSRPYLWIEFKERDDAPPVLTLYLKPAGAAQILRNNQVTVSFPRREVAGELFVVEAHGRQPNGREMSATKYVPLVGRYGRLQGRQLANALMSAESGAVRRLALAMFGGAGGPDVGEVASWREVVVDGDGNVVADPTPEQRMLAEQPATAAVIGEPTFEDHEPAPDPDPDVPDLGPRADEITPPTRPAGPRATFKRDPEVVKRWLGAWHAAVKGTPYEDADERHKWFRQWTAVLGWPGPKQTDSSRAFFQRCSEEEAGELLEHIRATVAADRLAADAPEEPETEPF